MTPEQREYFEGIHTRNIILKAHQLGFTTEVCIIQLDAALFESAKCALIAHTLNDAKRLFREKVKYAYDRLPAEIRAANPASNDSAGELVFRKGGSLYVSPSFSMESSARQRSGNCSAMKAVAHHLNSMPSSISARPEPISA